MDFSMLLPPAVSALAGTAAYKLTEDKSEDTQAAWTAGAAIAGLTATEILLRYNKDKSVQQFRNGYDLGRSDAVKQQYWIMQNRQKEDNGYRRHFKYYKFPGVTERDGVKYSEHDVMMRVEE